MAADAMSEIKPNGSERESTERLQRRKNYALMAVLFTWVVIIYLVAILRMGGAT